MILAAEWILTIDTEPIQNGAIVIKGEIIEEIGTQKDILKKYPQEKVKDLGETILMPGFVNLHTHLDYTILRGENDNLSFLPWIAILVQKSRSLEFEELILSAKLGGLEALAAGVTTIADTTATGASLQAASEIGLRGIIYQEVFGMDDEKLDLLMENAKEQYYNLKSQANSKLQVGLSPHAPYSVSGGLLEAINDFSQVEDIPLCMHLAETEEEIEFLVEGSGPFATTYREAVGWGDIPWDAPGVSAVKYLDKLGVLSDKLLAVHLAQANLADMKLLNKAGVRAVYCPKSNAKLGAGIADLPAILESGLQVGLGSDSAASNNSLDLLSEMEFGLLVQRASKKEVGALNAKKIVEISTIGGAKALGLESEIGTLESGKKADLVGIKTDNLANQPVYNPYSTLVYTASARDVILTMVDGEILYEEGKFRDIDEESMKEEVERIEQKIVDKVVII
jgi:5-methylthioadenosine/S-adenosylhomocysteine deaminase